MLDITKGFCIFVPITDIDDIHKVLTQASSSMFGTNIYLYQYGDDWASKYAPTITYLLKLFNIEYEHQNFKR